MTVEAAIVLLSDMHFGRDFLEAPETTQFRMSRLVRVAAKIPAVQKFIDEGCRGHSYGCVTALPLYLKDVLRKLREEGYNPAQETFDLFILLGDQVTVPDISSYKFLREYLTKRALRSSGVPYYGLDIEESRILAIPGNHDKLLLPNLKLYNKEFSSKLALPTIDPQSCLVHSRVLGGHEILFILIEASVFAESAVINYRCGEHLACGYVSPQLEASVIRKLDRLRRRYPVDGVQLDRPYDEVTKVMLVHYAVDLNKFKKKTLFKERVKKAVAKFVVPDGCERLDQMVTNLGREYKLSSVLHGHVHEKAIYPHNGVRVVAATTATQESPNNGFFILKVLDSGELVAEHHVWDGAEFVQDTHPAVNQKITDLAA